MLIGLDPLLTPDLPHALAAMGHGDRIAIVDANDPAMTGRPDGRGVIDLAGADAPAALRAILSLLPVDDFAADPALVMQVVGQPDAVPAVVAAMNAALASVGAGPATGLERHAFHAAAAAAYAIVRTSERRFYGNILITKGVVPPRAGA